MPKANRTCYCCGREYYYCPSCNGKRKDNIIYTMWDSELCMEIFNILTNESLKKISTLECKKKLIELGVDKNTVLKDSVRKHVDRVMAYEEVKNDIAVENIDEEINKIAKLEKQLVDYISDTSEEAKSKVEELKFQLEEEKDDIATCKETENESVKRVRKTRTRKSSLKNKENSEVD